MSSYLDFNGLKRYHENSKEYVDSKVPTKVSDLTNDSGYITDDDIQAEFDVRNLKTYTSFEQLGLTNPTTAAAIYKALSINSMIVIMCDKNMVTDLPDGVLAGILTITKKAGPRCEIRFVEAYRDSTAPANVYIGQLAGNDGTGLTWTKLATENDLVDTVPYNLIPFPYYDSAFEENGISWSVDDDGVIVANGEATVDENFICRHRISQDSNPLILPAGTYTLSGCPIGGGSKTYYVNVGKSDPTTNSFSAVCTDFGNGATFTIEKETQVYVGCCVTNGYTVNNVTFKPMLAKGDTTKEFRKNFKSVYELQQYITNQVATEDYVDEQIANLVDSAPDTMNTLNELATAISDNESVVEALDSAITNKVDKEEGKGLFSGSYNDLTNKPTIPSKVSELTNDSKFLSGTVGLTNGGTGSTSLVDAKKNLGIPLTISVGSASTTDLDNEGWFKVLEVPSRAWATYVLNMDIYPNNYINHPFDPVSISVACRASSATTSTPIVYLNSGKSDGILNKFYVVQNSSSATESFEIWYKNPSKYSELDVAIYNYHKRSNDNNTFTQMIIGDSTTAVDAITEGKTAYCFADYAKTQTVDYTLESFNVTATADELNLLDGVTATTDEINYLSGVTSNIQTQLNKKMSNAIALTNEDLDAITSVGFYYAGGGNTVTNKPSSVAHFGLSVYHIASGYKAQELTDETKVYYRFYNSSTWSDWTERKFTDTVYTHPTTSGNKHIPSGGSSGQILRWGADGTAVWGNDNNTTYSEATTSANGLMSSSDKTKLDNTNIAYATCSTAADTAAKVATITGNSNWTLKVGSIVVVKFTVTNTASSVTLNVNSTGAKSIWYNNAVYTGNSNNICGYANRYTTYMYDGTNWVWISNGTDSNTTYTNASLGQGYGTCSTAEATTAKVVSLSNYALTTGGIVAVKFTYAVPASATMNINSKGAKAIYNRGAAIAANIIKAGDIATFIYNGSQYHLLTVDRDNNSDTKNTTGTTNKTATKLFLAGATSQGSNPVTYSNSGVYIGTDNCLYSNSKKVTTTTYSTTAPSVREVGTVWIG